MPTSEAGERDWYHSEYSPLALGNDSGPWVAWLPLAWRAVADLNGEHPLPSPPQSPLTWREGTGGPSKHLDTVAWWGPLLQLLFFRLGWVRPDLGLARWVEAGLPDQDPVLRLVKRWWGPQVLDVLAWAGKYDSLAHAASRVGNATATTMKRVEFPDRWADRRGLEEWARVWDCGSDCMHLVDHALTPVSGHPESPQGVLTTDLAGGRHAVLLLPEYRGWYAALSRRGVDLPARTDGRSWRVDVVVQPLGWLGAYRLSRQTGRWFSGRHRWHQLGLDKPLAL